MFNYEFELSSSRRIPIKGLFWFTIITISAGITWYVHIVLAGFTVVVLLSLVKYLHRSQPERESKELDLWNKRLDVSLKELHVKAQQENYLAYRDLVFTQYESQARYQQAIADTASVHTIKDGEKATIIGRDENGNLTHRPIRFPSGPVPKEEACIDTSYWDRRAANRQRTKLKRIQRDREAGLLPENIDDEQALLLLEKGDYQGFIEAAKIEQEMAILQEGDNANMHDSFPAITTAHQEQIKKECNASPPLSKKAQKPDRENSVTCNVTPVTDSQYPFSEGFTGFHKKSVTPLHERGATPTVTPHVTPCLCPICQTNDLPAEKETCSNACKTKASRMRAKIARECPQIQDEQKEKQRLAKLSPREVAREYKQKYTNT